MAKLWQKGKKNAMPPEVEKYLISDIWAEQELVKYECIASKAHAKMLHKIGILKKAELSKLLKGLDEIINLDKQGKFIITISDEDVHTKVENYLVTKLGNVGKKIHTYRSRNDQLLVNPRLYHKEKLVDMKKEIKLLLKTLYAFSKKHENTVMPGYTHLQKAMLSTVGFWSASFLEALLDCVKMIDTAYELNDQCPLGSAASYGVPAKIDREYTAKLLGFKKVQNNSLYCQNSRGKIEANIAHACSMVMEWLGCMCTDIITFNTSEFGYFIMGDEVSTGSSIMPQKKNADVCELLRSNVNVALSYEFMIKNTVKDLNSGYMKDTQCVKEAAMKTLLLTIDSIKMMNIVISTLTVDKEKCKKACLPELFSTDYAYDLVAKGVPFREAYKKAAQAVKENSPELKKYTAEKALKKRSHSGAPGNMGLNSLKNKIDKII